jgi:hypothetical protein
MVFDTNILVNQDSLMVGYLISGVLLGICISIGMAWAWKNEEQRLNKAREQWKEFGFLQGKLQSMQKKK